MRSKNINIKKFSVIFGAFLLFIGIGLNLVIFFLGSQARSLDSRLYYDFSGLLDSIIPVEPLPPPPSCTDEALVFTRADVPKLISVNESQKLTVTLLNLGQEECTFIIELDAPDFNVSSNKRPASIINPGKTVNFYWILSPKKPKTSKMIISISTTGDFTNLIVSHDIGITITNVFGLKAGTAASLSVVVSMLGSFLTIPYWFDLWCKYKEKKSENRNSAGTSE